MTERKWCTIVVTYTKKNQKSKMLSCGGNANMIH